MYAGTVGEEFILSDEHTQVAHWWTGKLTHCPECGQMLVLPVYGNRKHEYAHCPTCNKKWTVEDELTEITREMTD